MAKIFDYLKLTVFVCALLIGVQVPGFVEQYKQNLNARVSESSQSLSAFQNDADKYFAGDINKLIKHYQTNKDPIILSGGDNINKLVTRNQQLINAQAAFNQSILSPYIHVFINPITEIRADVWHNYSYVVVLNEAAIVAGVVCGIVLLALFELFIGTLVYMGSLFISPKSTTTW
ncbi:DUF2937 family protein [Pseudoalteromonas sp. JBTF-M23]|uniref:DUF2937 family protein n=1 Tax=Pseudoalteromonas caenipelagi TaxID=2726988 RepID=A0A849VA13_9GAMM|nr:DUF2937 family protein [Pseudoalteromonas caenipelagi]NOU49718.1 DUF2937 family protein [Pseudoalteromonas caenipelagi]